MCVSLPGGTDSIGKIGRSLEPASARPVRTHEVGITELADRPPAVLLPASPQVATGETAEHRCAARVSALTLQGVVDLLGAVGHRALPGTGGSAGSSRPSSAKPRRRSRPESQVPHARPDESGA